MKRINPYQPFKFKRRRRNMEAFFDSQGRLHPIRGSAGYSSARAGEGGGGGKRRKKAKGRRRRKKR